MKKFKIFLLTFMLTVMSFSFQVIAFDNINILYNGTNLSNNVPVKSENGITYISIGDLCNYFGGISNYNSSTKILTVQYGVDYGVENNFEHENVIYNFSVGKNEYQERMYTSDNIVNNNVFWLKYAPKLIENRVMLSTEDVSNLFSYTISMNYSTNSLVINDGYSWHNTIWNNDAKFKSLMDQTPNVYNAVTHEECNRILYFDESTGTSYSNNKVSDKVPLYSDDGRIRYTLKSEVEAYKKVGWYETCPLINKTVWLSKNALPYGDFEPTSAYMLGRNEWRLDTITGFNSWDLKKINENQYKIKEFYFWENHKQVSIDTDTLLTGVDRIVRNYLVASWENPKTCYGVSNYEWNRIQSGDYIWVGMSKTAYWLAGHGYPDNINTYNSYYGTMEQFVYEYVRSTEYYYFINGYLSDWQDLRY